MPGVVYSAKESEVTTSASGKKQIVKAKKANCRATCTDPKLELLTDPVEPVAVDIEFQEHRPKGDPEEKWGHRMGRLAVVNTRGDLIYDTFVNYQYDPDVSTKVPPPRFGVFKRDLKLSNGAKENREVEENLAKIFGGRLVIGHGMRLDKIAVGNKVWSTEHIRADGSHGALLVDTQHLYGQINLETLAYRHLPHEIVTTFKFHDPIDDARATMLLYPRLRGYKGRKDFDDLPFAMPIEAAALNEEYPALK